MKRWHLTTPIIDTKIDGTQVTYTDVYLEENTARLRIDPPAVACKYYLGNDSGDQAYHSWITYEVTDLPAPVQAAIITFMEFLFPDLATKGKITAGELQDIPAE